MDALATWLETSKLAFFVNNTNWVWSICETIHFIGMALLIGCVGILDLRMLGVGKQLAAGPLHRLIPYGVIDPVRQNQCAQCDKSNQEAFGGDAGSL